MAVLAYYRDGVPLEQTIREATDLGDFLLTYTLRRELVQWRGQKMQKNCRWYVSTAGSPFGGATAKGFSTIADASRAMIVNRITDWSIPPDLDRDWYVAKARELVEGRPPKTAPKKRNEGQSDGSLFDKYDLEGNTW